MGAEEPCAPRTANRGLRFLGFARNDRGALWWNGGRASGRALARDARRFFASLKNDRGGEGGMARSRGRLVRRRRVTRGRFFASLKNDRGGEGGWLDLAGIRSGVGA